MSKFAALIVMGLVLGLGGCASMQTADALKDVHHAVCVLTPTAGNNVHGVITFTDMAFGVRVDADVTGLEPNSKHGFHIHQYGDIACDDGTCTGGHYDPMRTGYHALPGSEEKHHAGDMGNLVADDKGEAKMSIMLMNVTVAGATNPIIGRGIVVHAKPDDGGQPTGNAGGRIAVGVIGVAK